MSTTPGCKAFAETVSAALFGQTRRALLSLIFTRPDEAFYLRQMVRLTGKGLGGVQREITSLTAAGIVLRQNVGMHVMYRANPNCPVFQELRGLIVKTFGVADYLRACLAPLRDRIACAFLFGSFARGEHSASSDVDLMVVADGLSLAELVAATKPVQQQLGREVNPVLYRRNEFADKLRSGHHFLKRVIAGEKIALIGDPIEFGAMAQERLAEAPSAIQQRNARAAHRGRPRHAGLPDKGA